MALKEDDTSQTKAHLSECMGLAYYSLGKYGDAWKWFDEAKPQSRINDWLKANNDDPEAAKRCFDKAIEYQEMFYKKDHPKVAKVYYNRGLIEKAISNNDCGRERL